MKIVRPGGMTFVALTSAFALALAGSTASGQHCCGGMGARSLMGPSANMSPLWLLQMQAQLAQAQMLQVQLAQAQAAQAQQVLLAKGFDANFAPLAQPAMQPKPRPATRIKANPRPQAPPIKQELRDIPPIIAPVDVQADARRLSDDLVLGGDQRRELALDGLKTAKGVEYTEALATAIVRLDGDIKGKARDALADRLAGMKADTLRHKLTDRNFEIRRAAALACAVKEDQELVSDLISLMERDPESAVLPAVRAALKSLTERDFGPARGADREARAKAVAAWKNWWQNSDQTVRLSR